MLPILDYSSSITPWVLTAFLLALGLALGLTIKSWREARRSPYFFQRRAAMQQMQSYTLATIAILIASASVAAYAYSPTLVTQPRVKVIAYAKPALTAQETAREAIQSRLDEIEPERVVIPPSSAEPVLRSLDSEDVVTDEESDDEDVATSTVSSIEEEAAEEDDAVIVEEADEIVEVIEEAVVSADKSIGGIQFATNIDTSYSPVNPGIEFAEGNYKLYATFDYANVPSGSDWEWIWKHNGVTVGRESAQWSYGETGPGWVYFSPEAGFAAGNYSLEMWLDGELVSQSNMNVSASVANQ